VPWTHKHVRSVTPALENTSTGFRQLRVNEDT
jgi:hypothetical protein